MRGSFLISVTGMAGVEAVSASSAHSFSRHSHEQFGIGVIRSGAQRSASGRGPVEAGPGDLITVNPGEVHDGAPIGDEGRQWDMLYFEPPVILDVMPEMPPRRYREFHHPVLGDRAAAAGFLRLFRLLGADGAPSLEAESLLTELVAKLTGALRPTVSRRSTAGLIAVRSRIDDDPAEDLSLATLAQLAGLSRFQFLRGFAALTGLTPHAYRLQKRADMARRMIRLRVSLAEAAAASGFSDQAHMTRVFVGKYGLTPGAFAALVR